MIRTQVYLEESASKSLRSIAQQTGKKQSELIREAIDNLIAATQNIDRETRLKKAKGIWKDRKDLINIEDIRKEWDRKF
ncbi:MAG: ribbon-helix-helix domain-containing protein [Candidatus Latescibacteria bacterium]|nr:ribbon-helix-helix domain-containing protein [Candidatus Latescibacterota bacterium]